MQPMKTLFYFFLVLSLHSYNLQSQDSKKIETIAVIEIIDNNYTIIEKDTVPLSSVHKKVSQLLETYELTDNNFPSITLVVNSSVSENSIENIKYQIRSTPIQLINLQRKIINEYNGIEISQNILDQYNSLIKYWNTLAPEERYYRESDLKFVESVALNMTLNQRIRNEKLPGYLPFVKREAKMSPLSMFKERPGVDYTYVFKKDTLIQSQIKNYMNNSFQLKRRIINEEKVIVIELIED
jgi:hypothetical protein